MGESLLNIGLAFLEGLALIASPCILPILPIILSASLEGSKRRPFGVIIGFVVSFTLFTLFSRQLVISFGLDLNLLRFMSFSLLIFLGCIMISSYLTERFNELTQGFADLALRFTKDKTQPGFIGGVLFGVLVGIIWTPCAGPILAAVIVQTILQHSNLASFFTILAFGLGAAIPMFIIIIFGRAITRKISYFHKHAVRIRKILGVIIILAVIAMIFGPSTFISVNKPGSKIAVSGTSLEDGLTKPFPAPDFKDITAWINSPPLHINQLKGKVVLIDFWAYSCINCIRTLPYLVDWYSKYHDQGFEIVGVHSPEFDFERDLKNVQAAVKEDGIHYPVALDNQFATWNNYNNLYWPAHYLIDKHGNVVYEHFGEGDYDITENNIRYLLDIQSPINESKTIQSPMITTPETYLGYARSNAYAGNENITKDKQSTYSYPANLYENAWALKGAWTIESDKIISAQKNASIKINFMGKKVFAVMQSKQPINVTVMLNGAKHGIIEVQSAKLYNLIELSQKPSGILELIAAAPGLEIYTFTFGG